MCFSLNLKGKPKGAIDLPDLGGAVELPSDKGVTVRVLFSRESSGCCGGPAKRSKLEQISFNFGDRQSDAESFVHAVRCIMRGLDRATPAPLPELHFLVFLNPYSGGKQARRFYEEYVEPIFVAAGAKPTVYRTCTAHSSSC